MDTGAPSPLIISNDSELLVVFYADKNNSTTGLHMRNMVYDTGILILKFNGYVKYTFGFPTGRHNFK